MSRPIHVALQRIIGWLSFAAGASLFQPNDSIFYRVSEIANARFIVAGLFCLLGLGLVVATHSTNIRLRLALALLLLLMWVTTLLAIVFTGPLGAIGGFAIVIVCYLCAIFIRHVRDGYV